MQALLLEDYFPVIAITETWLDSSFMDFELGLNDYCVHRKDRQDRRGGGVLLAVHTDLISIRRRDLEYNDNIETVMVEICQKSKDNVLFGVCYRPPSADVEYSLKLRQCLERIEMTRFANFCHYPVGGSLEMLHFFFNVINGHYDIDISNKLIFCKDRNTGYKLRKMTHRTLFQILVELMVLNIVFLTGL